MQQYSGDCYQATEEFRGCVDGERTASENLVDWMGLEMSWRTFQRRIDQGQPLIPGLEQYSSAQSFFISFGLKFCDFEIREAMQQMLLKNNHSPKRTRLNGAVRNSATFAQVFNCPTGSAMNHREKCGFIH